MNSLPMCAPSWQAAAQQPPPAPEEIHVWRIDLAAGAGSPADAQVLSRDEHERAGRLRCEHARARFIAGRSALRRLLGDYLGAAPQAVTFRYGPHGKPGLPTGASPSLTFNFSHSKDLALLAVANARELGIDLEYRHRGISVEPLARYILCECEATALRRLPVERHKQALLTAWTRKEAYLKALGVGLARSLKSVSAGIADEDDEAAVRQLEDAEGRSRLWTFVPLAVHPEYLACLAVPASDWTLRCYDWRPLV
jgi:4'-phosphopantetheinyl transferase